MQFLRFFEYFCGSKNKYSKITDANSVFGAGSFSLINYMKNVLNGRRLNRNQAFANGVLHRRRFLAGKSRQEQAAAVCSVTVDFLLARGHFTLSNKAIGIDTRSEPLFLAGPKTLFPGAASPENLFTHIYLRIPRKNFATYSVQFSSISAKTHEHQQKFLQFLRHLAAIPWSLHEYHSF